MQDQGNEETQCTNQERPIIALRSIIISDVFTHSNGLSSRTTSYHHYFNSATCKHAHYIHAQCTRHPFLCTSLFGCSLVRLQITFDHTINSRVNQDCITVLRAICKLFKTTLYYLQQYKTQNTLKELLRKEQKRQLLLKWVYK